MSGGWQQPKIVVGRRVFVIPVLQKVQSLSLEMVMVRVESPKVHTKQGVAVSVVAMAAVKVAESEDAIRIAARQFLGRTAGEFADLAREILAGHQRSVLSAMTVEEIHENPDALARQIRKSSSGDMAKMGLEIVSLMVNDIGDDEGYLDALGVGRAAEVRRDAAIKRAEAESAAGIRNSQSERERQAARYEADTAIADARRVYDVQKAEFEREVNTRQAEAELAYQLQEAKTKQAIRQEELNVEIMERQQQIEVEEQEIARREKELAATIRKPAEAERYRMQIIAEGTKARIIAEAEAEAEAMKLRGEAQAEVIRARGFAEADVIKRKTELCGRYGQAALIQQLLEDLPEVARAMVQPPANIDGSVVINAGNSGADGAGAPKSQRDIISAVGQIPSLVAALTGIDLVAALKGLPDADPPDSRHAGRPETEKKAPIKAPSVDKPPSQGRS